MFRQSNSSIKFSALLPLVALILVSSFALAGDDPETSVKIEKTGDSIIITQIDDFGDIETEIIDLSEIGDIVNEALSSLETSQFQLHLGQDNMLSLAMDDTELEVDIDVILSQVGAALSQGFEEFDSAQWSHRGPRHGSHLDDEDLAAELDKLRAEMRSLKRELRKLKTD